jgi:hypothetical protein
MLKIKTIKVKEKTQRYQWRQQQPGEPLPTSKKIKKDFRGNEYEQPIKRTQHPYRHLTTFSAYNPLIKPIITKVNPVINPPKPKKPADRNNSPALKQMDELIKFIDLLSRMLPLVYERHILPMITECDNKAEQLELSNFINWLLAEAARGIQMATRLIRSGIDDRWKRGIMEWDIIIKYALETSPEAAAKKYYGIRYDDGEKVRLSAKGIRDKMLEIGTFYETYPQYYAHFMLTILLLVSLIRDDPELMEIYKRYEREYNDKQQQQGGEEEKQEQMKATEKQKRKNVFYKYGYFFVRHYDHELYERQKDQYERGLRKSKETCDGKIYHRIEEEDIQPEIAEALRREKKRL